MNWRHRFGHSLLKLACSKAGRNFAGNLDRLQAVQEARLASLMAAHRQTRDVASAAGFRQQFPVTGYADWASAISDWQARGRALTRSPLVRFQPTSGSTSTIKWLPYTRRFLQELDAAIGPWLLDMYQQYPTLSQGSHYWSLSWLPSDMRERHGDNLNDDSRLLSTGKRLLAGLTQSVPEAVSLAPTSELASFATLAWLASDADLAMVSVWSPTFALTQQEQMFQWRFLLAEVLEQGHWGEYQPVLAHIPCPRQPKQAELLRQWRAGEHQAFFATLWPRLALVSAWDTGAAAGWAGMLQGRFPGAGFQGKGLWATEGVVTFPWQERHLLAYQSHVYEFENLDDGTMLWPWELKAGMQVAPVISTGAGLMRYRLGDCMNVDGHLGSVPSLTFLGREDGVDLVGEKLATVSAQQVLDRVARHWPLRPVSLVAMDAAPASQKPGYVLLLEGDSSLLDPTPEVIAQEVDEWLSEHFHYRLARQLEQLAPLQVWLGPRMREYYLEQSRERGMVEGNIKVEPLRHWPGRVREPDCLALPAVQLESAL